MTEQTQAQKPWYKVWWVWLILAILFSWTVDGLGIIPHTCKYCNKTFLGKGWNHFGYGCDQEVQGNFCSEGCCNKDVIYSH